MSRCRGLASHLSKRQPCYHRWLPNGSAHIDNSAGAASYSTVAPSQVLRYALSGDSETHTATQKKTSQTKLDDKLELILSKRNFVRQRQHGRLVSLPGSARLPTDLRNVSDLQELKLWFEQYIADGFSRTSELKDALKDALLKCEKSSSSLEILSVLTTVISRLKDAKVPTITTLHIHGLYYAFQSFSVPAIRHHLALIDVPVGAKSTEELTQCLLRTLRTVRCADPAYDTRPMLELVAERTSFTIGPQKSFLNFARFNKGTHSSFIELLCELGASKAYKDMWDDLIVHLARIQRSPTAPVMVDDAYKSVLIFLRFGMTDYAVSCMNDISEQVQDISPSLQIATDLAAILNEKGLKVPAIVEEPIQKVLSQALEQQDSASTADLKSDDDFSIVRSLLARINSNGTSVSASKIAILIDGLNDCAGMTIPLFIESSENRDFEYAWSPQWIPGVSDSAMMSFSLRNSQTLGLLRAQIASRGTIISSERSRNLVQLGHLVRRHHLSHRYQGNWTKTGYLVAFDRISGEYLVIYVGEDLKIIDPEYRPDSEQSSSDHYEQHPLLGSLSHVAMPAHVHHLGRDISKVITPVKNAANRYVLDLDPGVSLQP